MTKSTFKKPPVIKTQEALEKEKKAEDFINQVDKLRVEKSTEPLQHQPKQKETKKTFLIRMPESYIKDLQEITNLTGISRNAICLELLRPAIKRKLKELKEK
ncbi:MAG: hypothetical protein KAT71_00110 [Gammaproteobacteria bacterium]|nr:hypothetical protein [Gammaproteobacteria bacterium]